jgi:hypothetical protein
MSEQTQISKIATSLYQRVIVSKGWTILGLLLSGAVLTFNEQILPLLATAPQPWLRYVAGLIAIYGASRLSPAAVEAWAAKKQAEQDAKSIPAAPPNETTGKIPLGPVALLLAGLAFAAPVFAQEAAPKFGGCVAKSPVTCFGPVVSTTLLSMSLKTGDLTKTLDLGAGYGVTFWADRWYKTGLSATFSFPTFEGARRLQPAGVVSFAEFGRVGIACPLYVNGGFRENAQLLLGFGADFGRW